MKEFEKVMSERTDEDLIKIVTIERDKYNPVAIEAAENEIRKRNIEESKFQITQEKVKIEKDRTKDTSSKIVGSGTRFLNFVIDFFAWLILAFILSSIVGLIIPFNAENQDILTMFVYLLFLLTFIAYYSIMEIKFQKTAGKFVTKTKVVKMNGEKPTNGDIITRSFCRLIPFDRISFLFVKNGIHDFLSKTMVVKD